MKNLSDTKNLSDDAYLEMRWRCLSLAADFDRLQRDGISRSDPRLLKLHEVLAVLLKDGPNRAEQVQMILSDKSPAPRFTR